MDKLNKTKKYIVLIGVLFLLPITFLVVLAKMGEHKFNTLPYMYEEGIQDIPFGESPDWNRVHKLPDFSLTNHLGNEFNLDSLKGKIWIVSFFATNSEYVLNATKQLLSVNYRYRDQKDIGILSLSLDPEHDTPEIMNTYIEQNIQYNVSSDKWQFLTGEESAIRQFMSDGFLLKDTSKDIATFYIVDFEFNIRGRYNANFDDDMKHIIEDVALLKKEYDVKAYKERKNEE
ncbi:MAG: protein SCO1/2 [Flavobacteriales bacterium]|jgi:protein SCO1/2